MGAAVVGERGPEVAHLPTGARVTPNRESEAMIGGAHYEFNFYNPVMRSRAEVEAESKRMVRQLQNEGVLPRG